MSEMQASVADQPVLDTVPKLLLRNAVIYADRPAMREKDLGIWQTWTWSKALEEIRALSIGLYVLGLKRGETLAIVGDNRPQLYWAFAAAQALGAIPVPMYQDSVADEMAYVLTHAEVAFAIVEDQEQVDKLQSIADRVPTLRYIAYCDQRGLKAYDHTRLKSYADIQEIGREELRKKPELDAWWRSEIAIGTGSDISVMLYTSGTTGKPKGVMLTHTNVVVSGQNANIFDHFTPDDTLIAYLPMAWVGDHIFSYGQAFAGGLCVCLPGKPGNRDRRPSRDRPVVLFRAAARVREHADRHHGAHGGCRTVQEGAVRLLPQGRQARRRESGSTARASRFSDRILYWFGDKLVYAPLRNRMGMSNLRLAYTAGEAIGPELFSFYRSLGINLKQLYGQTEASVFITLQPDGEVFPETVGKPGPGVEIKIDEQGEVLFKSPGVFRALLQERRSHRRDQDAGRLGAHRRRRLHRSARALVHHRSGQGRRPAQQWRHLLAEVPGKPDQVLSRDQGSGRIRPWPRLRDDVHQHRPRLGRQLGRTQQRDLRQLSGTRRASATCAR